MYVLTKDTLWGENYTKRKYLQAHTHTQTHKRRLGVGKKKKKKVAGQNMELVNEAGLDERSSLDIIGLLSLCWQLQTGFVPTGQMLRPRHLIWKETSE